MAKRRAAQLLIGALGLAALLIGLLQGVESLNKDDLDEDTRLALLGEQEDDA